MEGTNTELIKGDKLKIGDVIKVWWNPGQDQISDILDYSGPYKNLPDWRGVKIANFMLNKTGMTIFPYEIFEKKLLTKHST